MLGCRADAEDVVQEALIRAHLMIRRGTFDHRATIDTWLHRVVTNLAIDALRARRVRATVVPLADDGLTAKTGERLACQEILALLAALSPEQGIAIVLKDLFGHSSAEIAGMTGASEGAIEQRLVRGRAALRKRLDRQPEHGVTQCYAH
jgi:RNA polymerase sigma-70 factor (ECF subfamily)